MKRTIAAMLSLALILGLCGCAMHPLGTTGTPFWSSSVYMDTGSVPSSAAAASTPPVTTVPDATQGLVPSEPTEPTEPPYTPAGPDETSPSGPVPDSKKDYDIVLVSDYISNISQALAYATEDNFTGQVIYDFTEAYLRYGTVQKLQQAAQVLEEKGLGLLIWDAFRPLSAQAKLWQICPDPAYVSHPLTGNRAHCRGSAVDVTLIDLQTGEMLEMPTGFDEFSALADRDFSDCTEEAAKNALLLQDVMESCGFSGYYAEWWHFSDTETYPVEEYFDPAMPTLWYATCQDSMSLRADATLYSSSLTTIYPNETMELLGWYEKFAKVRFKGKVGYVLSNYIKPVDETFVIRQLDYLQITDAYTYEQMLEDANTMAQEYPELVTLEIAGQSELGRDIPVLRIGSEDAQYHVFFQAAIHGSEHLTAWLAMALADYWLDNGLLSYGDICWHIMPMSNPDGVTVAQSLLVSDTQKTIYQSDLSQGYTADGWADYVWQWKANGLGVDLNRNFPAGWDLIRYREDPSAALYAGEEPFSAAEAKVLRDYTLRYDFGVTVSYHTMGSLIYYAYGNNTAVNRLSKDLAKAVRDTTGYVLAGSSSVDGAGYKDWAIDALGIPSLTVEVGAGYPVIADREMYAIFLRNYQIMPTIALWLQEGL